MCYDVLIQPYTFYLKFFVTPSGVAYYTSRGHGCGFYSELILVESKALKQAHSKLCNCFSNAAIGKNEQIENRNCDRTKYIPFALQF